MTIDGTVLEFPFKFSNKNNFAYMHFKKFFDLYYIYFKLFITHIHACIVLANIPKIIG